MKKLTLEQVKEMRKMRRNGVLLKELSRRFKVSENTIDYHTRRKFIGLTDV